MMPCVTVRCPAVTGGSGVSRGVSRDSLVWEGPPAGSAAWRLDARPVVAAGDDRVPVLLDSWVCSGADVLTAVALGARAALLGRPFAWGLALVGEDGVRQVVSDVMGEFDLTLGLSGHPAVGDLSPAVLRCQ